MPCHALPCPGQASCTALTSLCSTWEQAIGWSSLGCTSFWHIRHSLQTAGAWGQQQVETQESSEPQCHPHPRSPGLCPPCHPSRT